MTDLPIVVDCHAHLDGRHLGNEGAGLRGILERCERYGVGALVFSLFLEEGGLELPLEEIEGIAADHATVVGVSLGLYPPLAAVPRETLDAQVAHARTAALELAREGRVVAIGEVGLDYYWPAVEHLREQKLEPGEIDSRVATAHEEILREQPVQDCIETQQALFRAMIELAVEADLPLVIHGRDAYADILHVLGESEIDPRRVMLHCFAGTPEIAVEAAGRGYTLSIPSSVGYRAKFAAAARAVDLSALVTETDSPYHSPFVGLWKAAGKQAREAGRPEDQGRLFLERVEERYPGLSFGEVPATEHLLKGSKRAVNEPTFVRCAATGLAEVLRRGVGEVCEATWGNAERLFGLDSRR